MRRCLALSAVLLAACAPAASAQTWMPIHSGFGISGTLGTDYAINVTGYDGTYLYAIVLHTAERRIRLFRSGDQGTTWAEMGAYAAAGGSLGRAVVEAGGRLYVPQSSGGAIFYSDTQGASWTSVTSAVATNATTVARLGDVVVVPRGASALARRSADGGDTWANSGTLLYAAVASGTAFVGINVGNQIVRSTDGQTWTTVPVAGASGITGLWRAGGVVYAKAAVGGLVASVDHGETWTAQTTAAAPAFNYGYATPAGDAWLLNDAPAQGTTVAWTSDRGAAIADISASYPRQPGTPNVLCTSNFSMTADYAIGNAWQCGTGTAGLGLYRFRLSTGVAADADAGVPRVTLAVGPVPSTGWVSVRIAGVEGAGRVAVYDALGRQLAVLHDGPMGGALTVGADVSAWAPGVYTVRVEAGGIRRTEALVVR